MTETPDLFGGSEINRFVGEYRFLSNFAPARVTVTAGRRMLWAPTTEHAYQALKTIDPAERTMIVSSRTPGEAKRIGRQVRIRPGWEEMKVDLMAGLLAQKFAQPTYRRKLLATGEATLIEGNDWGDTFWGVCRGRGANWLGFLLMDLRKAMAEDEKTAA